MASKRRASFCTDYHVPKCSADGWWRICEELPGGQVGRVLLEFPNMSGTTKSHSDFVFTVCMLINGMGMADRVPSFD